MVKPYQHTLPTLSGWVLVLLKLLLATVSASTNMQPPQSSGSNVFPPGVASRKCHFYSSTKTTAQIIQIAQEQPAPPPPTSDEIDVTRHREITSKAVSAILLLVLKWFKVSRELYFLSLDALTSNHDLDIMKFHHLGQHLLDTNCLLLILKMFSLQDLAAIVISKADSPDNKYEIFVAHEHP